MAQPRATSAGPSSVSPSLRQQPPQPLKLVGCRAPLCDVAVCLTAAAVAGVDVILANSSPSFSSPAAHALAAGASGPAAVARGGREAAAGGTPSSTSTLCGAAADGDTCVLITEKGSIIQSAYAICLYLTSQAATEQARETLLPLSTFVIPGQQHQQQDCGEVSKARPTRVQPWVVENWLAWAAFSLRAAVRGVRKDVLLQQLDFLEQHIGSPAFAGLTLPAMFVFNVLRYSFPTSTFSDWPSLSKWLAAVASSPVFAAVSRVVPPPVFAQFPGIRRTALLASSASAMQLFCAQGAEQPGRKGGGDTRTVERGRYTPAQPVTGADMQAAASLAGAEDKDEPIGSKNSTGTREKYYLTTAINYTNGPPHMGHVYEAVAADVIARYHRVFGRDVYFLTGTDEHGQKIANTAARLQKRPQDICDMYVEQFQDLNRKMSISNDFYIRTTMPAHKKVCQWLWERAKANGDIYLGTYRGWYNEREETFVSEQDARAADYKDTVSGKPLLQMEESSYFFRMSKYQTRLVEHIKQNPCFILPEERRRHILKRLEEPLHDLSCSRNTFSWGVPVPDDAEHVMYVWFDALTNYISGAPVVYVLSLPGALICRAGIDSFSVSGPQLCTSLSIPQTPAFLPADVMCCAALGPPDGEKYKKYWPANLHLIGKDILWFHTVIWPCMLMSASLPLPQSVFGHGFVLAADGEKMSKSLGNVVNPLDILNEHDSDSFRFYLMRAGRFGCDLRFEAEGLTACTNADLADTLGNLVHRALSLCVKFCDGLVPAVPLPGATALPPFSIPAVVAEVETCMKQLMLREASEVAMEACRSANKYLTDWAPWSLPDLREKQQVVRGALEAVYVLAHLLEPFIPVAAAQIFEKLNTKRRTLTQLSPWFDNLTPGTRIQVGDVLFAKKVAKSAEIAFQKCEIRLGCVVKAQPHPQFIKDPSFPPYMVLTVAFSREKTGTDSQQKTAVVLLDREIRDNPHLLLNRRVLAVCNVKPISVKGVMSQVMVLAGVKNENKPGDAAAEAELLQVAGEVADEGDSRKREDSHTACEEGEGATSSCNRYEQLGALIEAAGYPPVLKNRENVRTADMLAMDFTVQKDKSILLNGKFALRVGQNGVPVRCGRHTPTGKLVLV